MRLMKWEVFEKKNNSTAVFIALWLHAYLAWVSQPPDVLGLQVRNGTLVPPQVHSQHGNSLPFSLITC